MSTAADVQHSVLFSGRFSESFYCINKKKRKERTLIKAGFLLGQPAIAEIIEKECFCKI